MRDGTWFFYFGMERPFNDSLSGVIEYVESKPIMEDMGDSDVDGAITNVVLGVVGRVGSSWRWVSADRRRKSSKLRTKSSRPE